MRERLVYNDFNNVHTRMAEKSISFQRVADATFERKLVKPFRDGRGFEAEMRTDGPGI